MSTSLVQGLLVLAFLPYAVLAVRDELLHRRARRVSRVEQVLHLCVAVAVFAGVSAVFRRDGKTAREQELERENKTLRTAVTESAIEMALIKQAIANRPSQPGKSPK